MSLPENRTGGALATAPDFYAILDTAYVPPERWEATCRALLIGGAGLIQLRAKKESPGSRRALLERILPLFGGDEPSALPQSRLIVNDDIDLALSYPALGLHVGQDDLPAETARQRLGPDRILGLSTHSIEQARAALALGPAVLSYFAVGPIFATATKPDYTPVGLELIRRVSDLQPQIPFFCIGGINRNTAAEARAAGARRVVVVSDVLLDPDPAAVIRQIRRTLAA